MGTGRGAGLFAVLALASCGSGAGDEERAIVTTASHELSCPISAEARGVLADFATATERELEVATLGCSANEVSFVSALVANSAWLESTVDLAVTCTGPRTDTAATCASDLGGAAAVSGVDTCFRIGCETANVILIDVYATSLPHGAGASLSYASTSPFPAASVTYTVDPFTRWRCDLRTGTAMVSASLAASPVVAFATGESIDFTFDGTVSGVAYSADGTFTTDVTFPALTSRGTIQLTIRNEVNAPLAGTVVLGDQTLATMSDEGMAWQGGCAP